MKGMLVLMIPILSRRVLASGHTFRSELEHEVQNPYSNHVQTSVSFGSARAQGYRSSENVGSALSQFDIHSTYVASMLNYRPP